MNYDQAVSYIHETKKYGSKLGLSNITKLLELLGNPQDNLSFVHVAGTNGKGSVCAYVATTLVEAGYKTGLFISPYIEKFTERIQIDFNNMKEEDLINIVLRVKQCVNLMLINKMNHPTEFEINTAIAMTYFYEQNCNIVVLETGLGGRFDSTNVIKKNEVSIITSLGLDHVSVLGDSIDKIAFEKAGIIKENCPVVVYGRNDLVAIEVIKHIASIRQSKVTISNNKFVNNLIGHEDGYIFDYKHIKGISIGLRGVHQVDNAIAALEALFVLQYKGYVIDDIHILDGFKKTKWPGRLEVLSKKPYIICDGAHNPQAAKALLEYFKMFHQGKNLIFLMGVMRNKEYEKMAAILVKGAKGVICVQVDNERALAKEQLAKTCKKYCHNVLVSDTIKLGMDTAVKMAKEKDIICSFGSLYLIADVKKYVREKLNNAV